MPESNSPQWRNRITNYGVKPAKEFLAHPLNYRRHPLSQREAFRGAAREIGLIAPILENSRSGRIIDGHLRVEEAFAIDPDMPIPYVSLDLAPEEEPLALATFDALGAMAVADKELLDALLKEARTEDAALQAMLADLAKENGLIDVDIEAGGGQRAGSQDSSRAFHCAPFLGFGRQTGLLAGTEAGVVGIRDTE